MKEATFVCRTNVVSFNEVAPVRANEEMKTLR